jgi:DNA-binding IclR family transcriptional regulator
MEDLSKGVSYEQAMLRIYSEYVEMPGLQLTCRQAQRLFGLGEHVCARLLDELVDQKFLARQANGTYSRLADGALTVGARSSPKAPGLLERPA